MARNKRALLYKHVVTKRVNVSLEWSSSVSNLSWRYLCLCCRDMEEKWQNPRAFV